MVLTGSLYSIHRFPVLMALALVLMVSACKDSPPEYGSFEEYPVYEQDDLGIEWTPESTKFRVWAPTAWNVRLQLFKDPLGGDILETKFMDRDENGTWFLELDGNHKGKFYTFQIRNQEGKDYHFENWQNQVPGPYAKAVGINGIRGAILDMRETDPPGWETDKRPPLKSFSDIILYELHVRDLSSDTISGIKNRGQYLGLTETGTKNPEGLSTGIDHIKELGVTHVHLLPVFDFLSVNERFPELKEYNWGYDPQNYNAPEGSYSSDPWDPQSRIREFKQMVQALHQNGLRVVMDVVYNHTGATETSVFNLLAPQYFYRLHPDSSWSDASRCGNETASERPMMRKLMIHSVVHWAKEYHIDGFRFDLMGIHDLETMREIRKALNEVDPTIFIYGEGWAAGESPMPAEKRALKQNISQLEGIAAFSDDIRDGIKGHWNQQEANGFVSGKDSVDQDIRFGVVASTKHPQVDYNQVSISGKAWAAEPTQSIQYTSCHDDLTLWDKLLAANPDASGGERIKMQKLANAIVLTSQGIPFLHAGVEMCRTKGGNSNSYNAPDSVNALDWSRKSKYVAVFEYYKGLIALRKAHPAFRMPETALIQKHLNFTDTNDQHLVSFTLNKNANGDSWKMILVAYNGSSSSRTLTLPEGQWTQVVNENSILAEGIRKVNGTLNLPGISAAVLFQN